MLETLEKDINDHDQLGYDLLVDTMVDKLRHDLAIARHWPKNARSSAQTAVPSTILRTLPGAPLARLPAA